MEESIYLAKGQTRYEFTTLRGDHLIIKYMLVNTDENGRMIPKNSKSGGSYWCPVNLKTDERLRLSDRLTKAITTSKDMGNRFYRDLRSVGYKKVNGDYKPYIK